jgi:hypothetical protein
MGRYQVRIHLRGQLASDWSAVLAGLSVTPTPDGRTIVSGELEDQAALHGLLDVVRDLGLTAETIQAVERGGAQRCT